MAEEDPEGTLMTLAEVKDLLLKDEKERELSYDKRVALEHAKTFAALTAAKNRELIKKLIKQDRVTAVHAVKISELLPKDVDELRPIFAKERFTLEQAEIDAILEAVSKYR